MTGARDTCTCITQLCCSPNLAGIVTNKIEQSFYSIYSYSRIRVNRMRPKIILNFIDNFPHEPSLQCKTSLKQKSCHGLRLPRELQCTPLTKAQQIPWVGGLAFLAKDAQHPIPAGKVFYPKLTNPLLTPWVSCGCPGGRPRGKLMISA